MIFLRNLVAFSSSHSHTTRTRQPNALSAAELRRSREALEVSLESQNPRRVFGTTAFAQFGCLCQKQPWTKIAVLKRGRTMSGLPGRSVLRREKRKPSRCIMDRTLNSGPVLQLLIRLMFQLRCSDVILSAIVQKNSQE